MACRIQRRNICIFAIYITTINAMGKNQSDKSLVWVWQKILAFFGAVGIINLFSDFFPTLIRWVNFLKTVLTFMAELRDFVLYPITALAGWLFNIEIPAWLRSYIFLGGIIFGAYNYAHKVVCGFSAIGHPLYHPIRALPVIAVKFVWGIMTFPLQVVALVKYYNKERVTDTANVYEYFGKYVRDIGLIILLFVTVNYLTHLAMASS